MKGMENNSVFNNTVREQRTRKGMESNSAFNIQGTRITPWNKDEQTRVDKKDEC